MNTKENSTFSSFAQANGVLADLSANEFPCNLHGWLSNDQMESYEIANATSTTYGYVFEGNPILEYQGRKFNLYKGMYFNVPGDFKISGGSGILIEYLNYKGFFQTGGPIEDWGRLMYIDGCTDSLLLNPIKKGDPCFNALYFPGGIFQTQHTHPSYRIGMVVNGAGDCIVPDSTIPLLPGLIFIIHENAIHSFKTAVGGRLTVVSFHPDSDFGPEDQDHPMVNRTIVDGVSANQLEAIQTKEGG